MPLKPQLRASTPQQRSLLLPCAPAGGFSYVGAAPLGRGQLSNTSSPAEKDLASPYPVTGGHAFRRLAAGYGTTIGFLAGQPISSPAAAPGAAPAVASAGAAAPAVATASAGADTSSTPTGAIVGGVVGGVGKWRGQVGAACREPAVLSSCAGHLVPTACRARSSCSGTGGVRGPGGGVAPGLVRWQDSGDSCWEDEW